MHRPVTALVALLALAWACGSSGNSGPSEGPAGVVVEVDGTVLASRSSDGTQRELSAEAIIYADDTVTTGDDGFIKIRLDHNGAVLALSNDKKRTLRDSAAWKAKEGSDEIFGDGDDDRTAIAGRQGEKQAGETGNTVREVKHDTDTGGGDDDDDTPEGQNGNDGENKQDKKTDDKKDGDKKGPKTGGKKDDGGKKDGGDTGKNKPGGDGYKDPVGGGNCDEVACLLADKPMPCCNKYKKDPKGDGPKSSDLADKPSRSGVKKVITKLIPKVRACGAKVAAKVRFKIAPNGSASTLSVDGPKKPKVIACIKRAVNSGKFPKSRLGMSAVNYVFKK
jgi:hypothetical protein